MGCALRKFLQTKKRWKRTEDHRCDADVSGAEQSHPGGPYSKANSGSACASQALQDVATSEGHTDPALEQRIAWLRQESCGASWSHSTILARQRLAQEESDREAADCWRRTLNLDERG